MSGTAAQGLPPAPFIAPLSGSIEMRLQQMADVITQNLVTIAVLRHDMNVVRERLTALERGRAE